MSAYGCFADVYDTLTSNIDYKELAEYYDRIITSHGFPLSDMMSSGWISAPKC